MLLPGHPGAGGGHYVLDRCGLGLACSEPEQGVVWGESRTDCSAFANARDHEACTEQDGLCYFEAMPSAGGCATLCSDRCGRCAAAYDSGKSSCEAGAARSCGSTGGAQIGVCSAPVEVDEGVCGPTSCGAGAVVEVSSVRLRVEGGDGNVGATEVRASVPVRDDLRRVRCNGASGADCLPIQKDENLEARGGAGWRQRFTSFFASLFPDDGPQGCDAYAEVDGLRDHLPCGESQESCTFYAQTGVGGVESRPAPRFAR